MELASKFGGTLQVVATRLVTSNISLMKTIFGAKLGGSPGKHVQYKCICKPCVNFSPNRRFLPFSILFDHFLSEVVKSSIRKGLLNSPYQIQSN